MSLFKFRLRVASAPNEEIPLLVKIDDSLVDQIHLKLNLLNNRAFCLNLSDKNIFFVPNRTFAVRKINKSQLPDLIPLPGDSQIKPGTYLVMEDVALMQIDPKRSKDDPIIFEIGFPGRVC